VKGVGQHAQIDMAITDGLDTMQVRFTRRATRRKRHCAAQGDGQRLELAKPRDLAVADPARASAWTSSSTERVHTPSTPSARLQTADEFDLASYEIQSYG
jgi:hypothetical protein